MKPVYPIAFTFARLSDSDVSANGKGIPCSSIDINYQDKTIEVHVPVGAPLNWLDADQLIVDFKANEFTLMAQEFTNVKFHQFEGTLPWRVYAKVLGNNEAVFAVYRAKYSHVKPYRDENTRDVNDRMCISIHYKHGRCQFKTVALPAFANADTFMSRKMIISKAQHEAFGALRDDESVANVKVEVGDDFIVFEAKRQDGVIVQQTDFTE